MPERSSKPTPSTATSIILRVASFSLAHDNHAFFASFPLPRVILFPWVSAHFSPFAEYLYEIKTKYILTLNEEYFLSF